MECVERTQAVAKAMAEKQFELAVELRGRSFARNLETYKMLTRLKPPKVLDDGHPAVSFYIFNSFSFSNKRNNHFKKYAKSIFNLFLSAWLSNGCNAYWSSGLWYECSCTFICS